MTGRPKGSTSHYGGALACSLCGGPLRADARYGVCGRNPTCKLELGRRSKPATTARIRARDEDRFLLLAALRSAKHRASTMGLPYDLTESNLPPVPESCPVLGIRLQRGGRGSGRNNSPSLDRLRPAEGYVAGNVLWISHRANMLRRDATAPELRMVAIYAERVENG